MSDRFFFTTVGAITALLIGLALVWPQGMGAPSPGPFARPVVLPDYILYQQRKAARDKARADAVAAARRLVAEQTARESAASALRAPAVEPGR